MGEGQQYTPSQLLKQALRYKNYWGNKGGITVSGGEPLLQIDFLTELFRQAKAAGVHTTLDTSANPYTEKEPFYSKWLELMKYTDLVLLDIKSGNPDTHKRVTGRELDPVVSFARRLSNLKRPVWVRFVLVPGLTDDVENVEKVADICASIPSLERVEVLRFHQLGAEKWQKLHMDYPLKDTLPPSTELTDRVREQFLRRGLTAY